MSDGRQLGLRLGVGLLPLLGLGLLAYAVVGWLDQVPDPVATHFDLLGDPEDSLGRQAFFGLLLGVSGLASTLGIVAISRANGRVRLSGWAASTTFVSWLAAGIGAWTALSQQGLESWTQARGPTMATLFASVVIPALGAGTASALALQLPVPPLTWESAPHLDSSATGPAVWTQRVVAPWLVLPVMFGFGLITMGWFSGFGLFMWIGGLTGFAGAQMRSVQVTADHRGLTLAWGPLRLPRQRVPLADVRQASAIDIRPRDWGGWGYRGSVRGFGRAGAILRAGEGLRLDLVDGQIFVVTVDDPEIGAGILNEFVRRRDTSTMEG